MAYERINWENTPSTATPLNATNLNKMDEGIANLDAKFGNDGILDISKGGTGNNVGYIQTGYKALSVRGSKVTIEGNNNEASADYTHAEGSNNVASRNNAHVEGRYNVASGTSSHAEGESNTASGNYSHAGGEGNVAGYSAQTVVGKYNNNKSDTLFEVGNGTSDNDRKNAFEVSGDGISTDDGNTKIRFGNNGLGQYGYYKGSDNNLILFNYNAGTGIDITNNVIRNIMPQLGDNASFKNIDSVTQGQLGMFGGNVKYMLMHFDTDAEPYNDEYTLMLTYSGSVAIMESAVLYDRVMGMPYSNKIYAETTLLCEVTTDGTGTEADPIHVDVLGVIDGYVTAGWGRQSALGERATAEGIGTEASGNYAHAQGSQTTASGNLSTAMGYSTTASADGATAMGNGSTASGANSIAGGYNTTASGAVSTAIGTNTQATQQAQVAVGKYNKTNNDALVMVGNGTSGSARSNALEVLLNGDVVAGNEIIDGQGNTLSVLAEALTKTASGNPVVITDCAGGKARSLKTTIEAIQDLHGYDKPWAGGADRNLLPDTYTAQSASVFGLTVTKVDNGLRFVGVPNWNTQTSQFRAASSSDIATLYADGASSACFLKASNQYINIDSCRVDGNDIIVVANTTATTTNIDFTLEFMMYKGTAPTAFRPYSNECPISGRTAVAVDDVGVNIWDEQWEIGGIDQTTGQNNSATNCIRCVGYIGVTPAQSIYLKFPTGSSKRMVVHWYDKNKAYISPRSIYDNTIVVTVPSNAYYMRFYMTDEYGTTYGNNISVNYPSSFTDYVPYAHSSATIQLGQTVYGADINWDTGVMTVTDVILVNNTADMDNSEDWPGWRTSGIRQYIGGGINRVFTGQTMNVGTVYGANTTGNDDTLILPKDTYNLSQTEWKALATDVQIIAPLATPTTIQLTPTMLEMLKGYNRVSIEDGSIELGYIAKIA